MNVPETGENGGMLAEVANQLDDANAPVFLFRDRAQYIQRTSRGRRQSVSLPGRPRFEHGLRRDQKAKLADSL